MRNDRVLLKILDVFFLEMKSEGVSFAGLAVGRSFSGMLAGGRGELFWNRRCFF